MKHSPNSSGTGANRVFPLIGILIFLLLLSSVLSLSCGSISVTPDRIWAVLMGHGAPMDTKIILYLRLPRMLGAMLAGSALAVAGVCVQGVLSNPLASPSVLGVNAGAGFAVTALCAFSSGGLLLRPFFAFGGAFVTVLLVFLLSARRHASRMTVLLAGITVSAIANAGTDLILTLYPDAVAGYTDFRIGSLSGVTLRALRVPACIIVVTVLVLISLSHELDVLSLGEEMATSLGVRVRTARIALLVLSALLAGAVVSFAGMLGFVGLLAPHIVRGVLSSLGIPRNARGVLLCSVLFGASFLLLCDTVARCVFAPHEISVGILLSVLGGSFFLYLLFVGRGGSRD